MEYDSYVMNFSWILPPGRERYEITSVTWSIWCRLTGQFCRYAFDASYHGNGGYNWWASWDKDKFLANSIDSVALLAILDWWWASSAVRLYYYSLAASRPDTTIFTDM